MFHCVICMNTQDFQKKRNASPISTPCGHVFHRRCLTRWIISKRTTSAMDENRVRGFEQTTCPSCNSRFYEEQCVQLFIVDPEQIDKSAQTDLIVAKTTKPELVEDEPKIPTENYELAMEKLELEIQLTVVKQQAEKLQTTVINLLDHCVNTAIRLELAENIIAAHKIDSVLAISKLMLDAGLWNKRGFEQRVKKRGIWRKIFKTVLRPASA